MKLIVQILCYNEESTLPHSTHSQVGQYRWQWRRDWRTLGSAGGQPLRDGKIKNNTVNDVELGIWDEGQAFQLWDIDIIDVSANTITNGAQGIFIYGDAGGDLGGPFAVPAGSISRNCFSGMAEYGISVDSGATGGSLDAEKNWWGDASGPFHATLNTGSTGYAAIGDVDFDHWLTKKKKCIKKCKKH